MFRSEKGKIRFLQTQCVFKGEDLDTHHFRNDCIRDEEPAQYDEKSCGFVPKDAVYHDLPFMYCK
jgi:hypothetical protein